MLVIRPGLTIAAYYPLLLINKLEISQAVTQRSFSSLGFGYLLTGIEADFLPHRQTIDAQTILSTAITINGVFAWQVLVLYKFYLKTYHLDCGEEA